MLYCQQFAFAAEMVGPCARILSCKDTELDYRWTYWTSTHAPYVDPHSTYTYDAPDPYPPQYYNNYVEP